MLGRNGRLFAAAMVSWLASANGAMASDRWEEAAGGAVAILPVPAKATGIIGGSLYCAEQKWSFLFRTGAADSGPGSARIDVDGRVMEADGIAASGTLRIALPTDSLEGLKAGARMHVSAGTRAVPAEATFNLRNSSKVIDAIAQRCSPVDMSAYQAVSLDDTGSAVEAATVLFAEEIALFREAAGKDPHVAAVIADRADAQRLLFGMLCGSTRYYGRSGCTLHGWAAEGAGNWRQVYATEGVNLYLDESRAHDGWPGLATAATTNGSEPVHWIWRDGAYVAEGEALLAEDQAVGTDRTAQ